MKEIIQTEPSVYLVDKDGNYLGAYGPGTTYPDNAVGFVKVPPKDAAARHDGSKWVEPVIVHKREIDQYLAYNPMIGALVSVLANQMGIPDPILIDSIQMKFEAMQKSATVTEISPQSENEVEP